ncbi:hypothetical protein [Pseudomonas chlororaphis]|uniref:Uncharacterized protein n=1 Tax=Pseudomonas chlororaphis TaxID=587753 RepID=A0A1Q8ES30_9PSED|nr:hypothetical protein [Pseudomonas chlororaphis]OLF54589.1 hypothetical protein BTN82_11335 [Pseudomonas chlororaphis]
MSTSAAKSRSGCLWLLLIPLVPLAIFLGRIAVLPSATVHYPKDGKEVLRYIWNVQHRIDKGALPPGGSITDYGHLAPGKGFFMEVDWWGKNTRHHCVSIEPKWPNTQIYLDANGDIDYSENSGTDKDRILPCQGGTFKP